MSHDEDRPRLEQHVAQCVLAGSRVECREALVEDDQPGPLEQRPRQAQPAPLAVTELLAAAADQPGRIADLKGGLQYASELITSPPLRVERAW